MKPSIVHHLGFALTISIIILLIPTFVIARQDAPSSISHPLEGYDDCLACHRTGAGGAPQVPEDHSDLANDTCQICHQPDRGIVSAPASMVGRDDCVSCHETGVGGAPPFPADHAEWSDSDCWNCHQLADESIPTPTATLVPIPAPAAASTPEAAEDGPPNIPHDLAGRDDCLMCHEAGVGGAPQYPADHAGRTSDTCLGCHQPVGQESAAPTASEPDGGPPNIPHDLAGRDDCLMCHEAGVGGAPQYPADHAGRTSDTCLGCHQPASGAGAGPATTSTAGTITPNIPHTLEARDNCLACHGSGLAGFPQFPDNHVGRPNDICLACHQVSSDIAHGLAPTYANIPHPLEERDDCRACHATGAGAPQFPADHTDRPSEICLGCHQPKPPQKIQRNCLDCHIMPQGAMVSDTDQSDKKVPTIPHMLIGYDDCLGCHQTGVGGATILPDDHTGRGNDFCRACHQSAPPPEREPIPTPVALFPWPEGVNSCRDCHLKLEGRHVNIITEWENSIHAERNIACADCHGGDPGANTEEEAMSTEAGYIGIPNKSDIPALCAGCHADVARMRQFGIPTDQYAKYQESIHGFRLSKGDRNVATCYDCHGGHEIRKVDDSASTVYPSNVPATCATCHTNDNLISAYNIPTHQYELYRQSVHGQAVLNEHNFNAPTCATCHGTHGAAPPGYGEVANVCGSCHADIQKYYAKSPHASAGRGAPNCVSCHGGYDTADATEAIYLGEQRRHCGSCHYPDTPASEVALTLYEELTAATNAYENAEAAFKQAQVMGIVVEPLAIQLDTTNGNLMNLRMTQHTLDVAAIVEEAQDIRDTAVEVKIEADTAVTESLVRRKAMAVAVAIIGLLVIILFIIKRRVDHQLKADPKP